MKPHLKLRCDDVTPLPQPTWYRELVGSLIYLSATPPDIFRLYMSPVSLLVLPPHLIIWHYFVCFAIFKAPFLDHFYTIVIHHFIFRLILKLGGLMILTHVAPLQASTFFGFFSHFLALQVLGCCLSLKHRGRIPRYGGYCL